MKILAINPGSTSTKTALYSKKGQIFRKSISHDSKELALFSSIIDQLEYRKEAILNVLKEVDSFSVDQLEAVVGRGGLLKPLQGGVYAVNEVMKVDLRTARYGSHASNLGALIADLIAQKIGVRAFIVDPIVVDELCPLARYSGIPEISRKSIFHALNHKATARKAARKLGKKYSECNLIVAHMGGGTTIGIHVRGRVIDVNNGLDGDGPFSIERAGTLPAGDWMRYVLSHSHDSVALQRMLTGSGGVAAYLGSKDAEKGDAAIQTYLDGKDESGGYDGRKCLEVMQALCYQISKEICSLSSVVSGRVDAVVLTGGLAYNTRVVEEIKGRVAFLAPVMIFPGENELESMAMSVIEALEGREEIREYQG